MTLPDAQLCDVPGCEHPAADPGGSVGLCDEHRPDHDGDQDAGDTTPGDDTGESAENAAREAGSTRSTPTPDTSETTMQDTETSEYRRIYLDAAERAGRETWEFVEEEALRAALVDAGFPQLLDRGDLFGVSGWRVVDTSDGGEEPARRWYYPSENEPRPDEFRRFHELLTQETPDGYEPFYFRVQKAGKAPATEYGSWKDDDARLSVAEAVDWMKAGGNVGIAGTPDDALVNVDIDDDEATTPDDVPTSLRVRSRSRTGWHTWFFDDTGEIPNIPTDEYGEIRTDWQYVVAPGSFAASCGEEIPDDATDPGYYTLEDSQPVASIEYDDLPEVFREVAESTDPVEEDSDAVTPGDNDSERREPTGEGSAVFDVEATDLVNKSDPSERFTSIFHGSGTGANMSVSNDKLHCWRHGVAHGGLQALAVLSDEVTHGCRRLGKAHKNSGAGRNQLKDDWRLVWAAWHEAKGRGEIPDDDPIPFRALVNLAVRDGLVDREALVERPVDDGEGSYLGFPDAGTYNAALEHVREEFDLNPGREPVDESHQDAEPVAALPFGALDALSPEERKRAVRRRGVGWPSTDDAREQLRDALFRELRAGNTTVLDAPTALGKSYAGATEPWRRRADVTGGKPVVHLHATTDARGEAVTETTQSSATGAVLKGRTERCPVAAGDHDPVTDPDAEDAPNRVVTIDGQPAREWFDLMCDEKGLPFSTAHALAREHNDQGRDALPCCDGDHTECPAVAQWDGLPRDDGGEPAVDVIHATHEFAYVPSLRAHTNVILDEQPDFTVEFSESGAVEHETAAVKSMVTAYLQEIDAPVSTWEAFVSLARYDPTGAQSDADAVQRAIEDALGTAPPTGWFVEDPDAHALAPALTEAIWEAIRWDDADANGRRHARVLHDPPRFDSGGGDGDGFAGVWLSVVLDENNMIQSVRSTPDFSQARAVIGLDAHPSMPLWQLNVDPDMGTDAVLDADERRLWRRYERGLTVVQVGDATRPRSGPNAREWTNEQRVRAVLDRLHDEYDNGADTAITTAQAEPVVRQVMADIAGSDPTARDDDHTLHYGEEKSRNPKAFADADAGYVYGCMDPGDDMVLNALAELGLDATPGTAVTDDGDVVREKGRTFDGDDADTAAAVLASVRENHVAQAAGRYARNPDADGSGATVFVHTDAAPEGFVDVETPGVEWLATDLQQEIIDELNARPTATTREIAAAVGCTKEHVRDTLTRLVEKGVVDRASGTGDHGADEFRGDGVSDALAGLGVDETTNDPLLGPNRWSLAICPGGRPDARAQRGESTTRRAEPATSGGDPPPEPGD